MTINLCYRSHKLARFTRPMHFPKWPSLRELITIIIFPVTDQSFSMDSFRSWLKRNWIRKKKELDYLALLLNHKICRGDYDKWFEISKMFSREMVGKKINVARLKFSTLTDWQRRTYIKAIRQVYKSFTLFNCNFRLAASVIKYFMWKTISNEIYLTLKQYQFYLVFEV